MICIEIRCDRCQAVGIARCRFYYPQQLRQELKAQSWKYSAAGRNGLLPEVQATQEASFYQGPGLVLRDHK